MAKEIQKLDEKVGSQLRRSQVITQVSDIVRELVDNSIDAEAHSVQVFLDDYGIKKIEVKDTGHGVPAEDIQFIIAGGHTSKLNDLSHLSCDQQYGFRGEALAAICSFSNVIITTKTDNDECASKYVLDNHGKIVSKNRVALGTGTNIVVRNLFEKFPIRKNYISQKTVCRRELKEIESYMKALGVAHYKVFFSLFHNGHLIWSKPSVKSIEQSLTIILGVNLAKKLSKCPTVQLNLQQADESETDEPSHSWAGTIELFVPSPPVDMKLMGFTSSKMLMIFVNRRRVYIKEYEKLIKRYAVRGAEIPTQAEQRKFPIAVVMIEVPPNEVDFNRDMDKSKIFLTCRDLVRIKLEEALQSFYGIDLSVIEEGENVASAESDTSTDVGSKTTAKSGSLNTGNLVKDVPGTNTKNNADISESSPIASTKTSDGMFIQLLKPVFSTLEKRRENISFFMQDLASKSDIGDPKPTGLSNKKIRLTTTTSSTGIKHHFSDNIATNDMPPPIIDISADSENFTNQTKIPNGTPVVNFTIDIDDINLDDICIQLPSSLSSTNFVTPESNCFGDKVNSSSTIIQVPGSSINTERRENQVGSSLRGFYSEEQQQQQFDKSQQSTSSSGGAAKPTPVMLTKSACPFVVLNGYHRDSSSLSKSVSSRVNQCTRRPNSQAHATPAPRKLKLFDTPTDVFQRGSRTGGGGSGGDGRKPRQITLESLKNWSLTSTRPFLNQCTRLMFRKPSCISLDANVSLDDNDSSGNMSTLNLENESSPNRPLEGHNNTCGSKSLVGLIATVNLKSAMQNSMTTRTITSVENDSPKAVSRLSGTNYFIVKVDGLLAVFNPSKVLEFRPHLQYQYSNNTTSLKFEYSNDSVESLLDEFTKFASILKEEQVSAIFHVLTDLHSA